MALETRRPTISVVMATYNGERFVEAQLESFAAQTLCPAELVVGDDGSSDATLAIVERFATRAPFPVDIVRNPVRLGSAENFLSLAARARGPIVALSDWDDVWLPIKLERVAPWFGDPSVGMVVHRDQVVDEQLQPLGRSYPTIRRTTVRAPRRIDPWFSGTGHGVFRKALLEAVAAHADRRPREAGGHSMDHDDWIYLLSGSLARTVLLAEDLALYRQHGGAYMGAPGGDVDERVNRGLRLGATHFREQAEMFRERAAFWDAIAADVASRPEVRQQANGSAAWSRRLASLSDARAGVRDGASSRTRRLGRLASLAFGGGYGRRTSAGLGARALAGDLIALAGRAGESREVPNELARRVAASRAAGRSPESVIAELSREGVPPLYGNRWTLEMIRDLVFTARRAAEQGPPDPVRDASREAP